jgi:hypothetical protein
MDWKILTRLKFLSFSTPAYGWSWCRGADILDNEKLRNDFQQALLAARERAEWQIIGRQLQEIWHSVNWTSSHPDAVLKRHAVLPIWESLWRAAVVVNFASEETGQRDQHGQRTQYYRQLRFDLEHHWAWNFWVTRYLSFSAMPELWDEETCQYLLHRIKSGPHRPYALTLCWKVLLSPNAPAANTPASHLARRYIAGLSRHLHWYTLSDYHAKRFVDWQNHYQNCPTASGDFADR